MICATCSRTIGRRCNWDAVGLATLYGAAYAGLFLGLACFLFRRKPLTT